MNNNKLYKGCFKALSLTFVITSLVTILWVGWISIDNFHHHLNEIHHQQQHQHLLADSILTLLTEWPPLNIKSAEATAMATAVDAENSTLLHNGTRSYVNSLFGLSIGYPSSWSATELNARALGNSSYSVVLLRAPLENAIDSYVEKMLFGFHTLKSKNMTLDAYTSSSLDAYQNATGIQLLESAPTTLGGQPGHRIVYTEDVDDVKLKKIQVWTIVDNNKAYVITFASEEPKYAYYLPQVENIISSFNLTASNNTQLLSSPLESFVTSSSPGSPTINQSQVQNQSQQQMLPESMQSALLNKDNLTLDFNDPNYGIKLQYPASWTRVQPGQSPTSERNNIDVIVAFLKQGGENASSSPRIGIGAHRTPQNLTLDQYTSNQIQAIIRQNANVSESLQGSISDNPSHNAVFTLGNSTKVMQTWTLKGDKAFLITYQTSLNDYVDNLPTLQKMLQSIRIS